MEQLENLFSLYSACGWGILELRELNMEKATCTIRATENFECATFKGQVTEPRSHFMRGHLSGVFAEVFGRDVLAKEVKCVAMGDPHCEFSVEPTR